MLGVTDGRIICSIDFIGRNNGVISMATVTLKIDKKGIFESKTGARHRIGQRRGEMK
jgi:hypothetical protein